MGRIASSGTAAFALRASSIALLLFACEAGTGRWAAWGYVPYVLALVTWFAAVALNGRVGSGSGALTAHVLLAALVLSGFLTNISPAAFERAPTIAPWLFAQGLAFIGVVLLAVNAWKGGGDSFRDALTPAILVFGLLARVWALAVSPTPEIDVWYAHQTAAADVLAGVNPYAHAMPEIHSAAQQAALGYSIEGYPYLPANLFIFVPFITLLGDTRYALIVFELAGIALLWWRVVRPHRWRRALEPLVLMLAANPTASYGIELGWNEPLATGLLCVVLALATSGISDGWLGAVLGGAISIKQPFFVFFNLWELGRRPMRVFLAAAIVLTATLLPFFVLNPRSFVNAISLQARVPFAWNNLSLNALLEGWLHWHVPAVATMAVVALIALGVPCAALIRGQRWGSRAWDWNASLYLVLVAFTTGFFNYHVFTASLMVLATVAWAVTEEPSLH